MKLLRLSLLIPLLCCISCTTSRNGKPLPKMDDAPDEHRAKVRYKVGKPVAVAGDKLFVLGAGFSVVAGVSIITFPLVVPGAVFMLVGVPPHYLGNAIAGTKPDYGRY